RACLRPVRLRDGVVGPRARPSFFFQAEDGIRDRNVTGVQTCALPICTSPRALNRLVVALKFHGPIAPPTHQICSSGRFWTYLVEIGRASCRERVETSDVAVVFDRKVELRERLTA